MLRIWVTVTTVMDTALAVVGLGVAGYTMSAKPAFAILYYGVAFICILCAAVGFINLYFLDKEARRSEEKYRQGREEKDRRRAEKAARKAEREAAKEAARTAALAAVPAGEAPRDAYSEPVAEAAQEETPQEDPAPGEEEDSKETATV